MPDFEPHVIPITHLRDSLGWAYLTVVQTGEPIIIQRYNRQDVVFGPPLGMGLPQGHGSGDPGRGMPLGGIR